MFHINNIIGHTGFHLLCQLCSCCGRELSLPSLNVLLVVHPSWSAMIKGTIPNSEHQIAVVESKHVTGFDATPCPKSTCRGLLQSCILVSSAHWTFPFQVWAHPRCARAGDGRERSVWLWVWLIAWCIDEAWVFPRLPFLRSAPADDATREAGLFLHQWEQCQTFPKFISMSNSTSLGELRMT